MSILYRPSPSSRVFGAKHMISVSKHSVFTLAVALAATACGGGGGASKGQSTVSGGGGAPPAVVSASGTEVSKAAEDKWYKAMAAFEEAEKTGWNSGTCSSVSSAFDDANQAQGGSFAEAVFMSGLSLDRCGQGAEALSRYERTLQMKPTFCKARVGIGLDLVAKGREQEAYAAFQKAVQDDARCTEGYTNLATLQMARGEAEMEEALNNLRRALAIDAQFLPAFNQMALLFLERAKENRKMLDLAGVVCRQAQLIDADYAPIYNTWGLINVRKKNIFDALRMFEKSFQLDDGIFEAHMNFGQITLSFRGYEDAKLAFTKATALKADSYDAHIGLGAALRGLGDAAGAKAEYEKAMSLDGGRPEAYFNLGLLYQDYMSGSVDDMKTALKYYSDFVSKAKGSAGMKDAIEDVERRCKQEGGGRRKKSSKACRPGRRQNIETAVEALEAMAEMEAESAAQQGAEGAQ